MSFVVNFNFLMFLFTFLQRHTVPYLKFKSDTISPSTPVLQHDFNQQKSSNDKSN